MRRHLFVAITAIVLFSCARPALATDGYFQTGYGQKVIAMGGASDGLAIGAMSGANNPASIAFFGKSIAVAGSLFVPHRSAERIGNAYGLNGSTISKDDDFIIPEFGFNAPINARWSYGITIYGNGGMATDYAGSELECPSAATGQLAPANLLCGSGHLGVNLEQVIIAPTVAYKITPNFAVAVSPQIIYQIFSAEGLQAFKALSIHPEAVTNNGADDVVGIGLKLGFFWKINSKLSVGGFFAPQADMARFKKYSGLFAGNGSFNVPANFSLGFGWHPTQKLTFAADFQRILYREVPAIGNPSASAALLGTANGPGFGWANINVYKFGVADRLSRYITVRAGFNHADNPISSADVTFNILAPGVVQNQISAGLTFHVTHRSDITLTAVHAFANSVAGATSLLLPGGGTDRISLEENVIGIGFLHRM